MLYVVSYLYTFRRASGAGMFVEMHAPYYRDGYPDKNIVPMFYYYSRV